MGLPKFSTISSQMPCKLSREVGEARLLHGPRPDHVLDMLHNGLDARLSSLDSAFGVGIYLAEDSEKVDQYAMPDERLEAEGMLELHKHLFHADNAITFPDDDLFYCFVVRAALGAQLVTKGLNRDPTKRHCDEETGNQFFTDTTRRETIHIPGTSPPARYNSMRIVKGRALKRFREFVVFDANLTLPEYLVAYRRV